jgi:ubiquinone/menaquinone biosynthesis C-methylase UbiE
MGASTNEEQARIYEERAEDYDALIAAEDADGALEAALAERIPWEGRCVADVGAGTGRLARWIAPHARHVHLVDRAAPMLEVARRRLAAMALSDRITIHHADARVLPLEDASVDVAIAGWVFGHFRHWMPEGWRDEVDRAVAEMRRVVVPGGPIAIIETLGTGHEAPRAHAALDEYFAHLESTHHFSRSWFRTDYVFDDVETAARVLGGFFGDALVARIRERGWRRVPECTALFVARAPG